MKNKKILAFTTIRSDYDLMSDLYKRLHKAENIELKLLVAGAHMSSTYGMSVDLIEKDGLDFLLKIETLIDANSKSSRIKTASLLLQNSIDIIAQFNPDLIIYAGDREDVMVASMIGSYLEIPTVHFFGGDHMTDGHVDTPIRHATSKLSSIHMVSIEEHAQRLCKMGESNRRIFNIGSIALDKFVAHQKCNLEEIQKEFGVVFDEFALMIFHPGMDEKEYTHKIFRNILKVLEDNNINAFISSPNTDPGNRKILEVIEEYKGKSNFKFYKNLPRELFLSIYKHSKFIIGNSSSGIIEAASIPIPAINVGSRQTGRLAGENVVFCTTDKTEIQRAVQKVCSSIFLSKIKTMVNPYGDGKSVGRAFQLLTALDYKKFLLKTEDPLDII